LHIEALLFGPVPQNLFVHLQSEIRRDHFFVILQY